MSGCPLPQGLAELDGTTDEDGGDEEDANHENEEEAESVDEGRPEVPPRDEDGGSVLEGVMLEAVNPDERTEDDSARREVAPEKATRPPEEP